MSLPRLRRRVDAPTFAAWREVLSGVGLPTWFDAAPGAGEVRGGSRGVTVPPLVGAALTVHTDPRLTVLLALRDGTAVTTGCIALGDDIVSSLVRCGPAERTAWVEVALVPVERLVEEVVRWIPPRPSGEAGLDVRIVRADDTVAGWAQRWTATGGQGWRVVEAGPSGSAPDRRAGGSGSAVAEPAADAFGPGPVAEVATLTAELRFQLTGCLAVHDTPLLAVRDAG